MFKKKKAVAKHDDVKLAGAINQQAPIDVNKIIAKSNKKTPKNGKTR